MKKLMDEKQFKRMQFEFNEIKDVLPADWSEIIANAMKIIEPWIIYEFPLAKDVLPAIKELIYKQYAHILENKPGWVSDWVHEIAELNSTKLADRMTELFMDFEAGINLTELYDNFDRMVEFYARPHELEPPVPLSSYDWLEIPLQEKEQIIKERYEESKQDCDLHNRLQKEFIDTVQPYVIRYFGDRMDDLDLESWNHYGIELGSIFYEYNDDCIDLEYILMHDELDENPGMGFYEYNKTEKDEVIESIEAMQ